MSTSSRPKYWEGAPREPWARVYATATEVLGSPITLAQRITLWEQISAEQALKLIAQMLNDVDTASKEISTPDKRWADRVQEPKLRARLLATLGLRSTLLAPQLLLLAAGESLTHSPEGPGTGDLSGIDIIFQCLLGIGDESGSVRHGAPWGGSDAGLASEVIANLHFNRSVSVGHQLAWTHNAWLKSWPGGAKTARAVGGQPRDLFLEATGIEIEDFAAIAMSLYAQGSVKGIVRFPPDFFTWLGFSAEVTDYFLDATSISLESLRRKIGQKSHGQRSQYAFNELRRFPLVKLTSGELLVLRTNYLLQRALSDVTFFDVSAHLKKFDEQCGTKRDAAFRSATNQLLEYEVGVILRRIFAKTSGRVFAESELQLRFQKSRKKTPSVCDFAVKSGNDLLLVEVTDRAIPDPVVNGRVDAALLDKELGIVLTDRKAGQLDSTINLWKEEAGRSLRNKVHRTNFIPLVLTSSRGLPWNQFAQSHIEERTAEYSALSGDSCSSLALITLRDLLILENAFEEGHDVFDILKMWRQRNPGLGLDQFMSTIGLPLDHPKWERDTYGMVMGMIFSRLGASDHDPQPAEDRGLSSR
ncbi:hypothetical protein Q2T94_07590 [Paeniglutamicibacter sulfureus]|uniref:hypothetical protein n=1 Tax=Paeniglutamicibacter sulfureus TaxID=43666 RepID=UPI002664F00D|nr:hypothetical protein [Paeniglutamicibacter sulfureus]MDO2934157.1 hypothetical protein [Paeniglutamicibacter sulfureus]